MGNRAWMTLSPIVGVTAAVCWAAVVPVISQSSRAGSKTWQPARTSDGQPDLQGVWTAQGFAFSLEQGGNREPRGTAAGFSCDLAERPTDPARTLLVDPEPGGKLPFQPWAALK